MSTEQETTRVVRSWLEEGVTRLPDRVLDAVIDQVPATPQRRHQWSAWRPNQMNLYAKLLAGAAAALVVAVVGYQFLPGRVPGTGSATVAPSPTSLALIARGTFNFLEGEIEMIASGAGDNVTGTMTMSHVTGDFTVDLKCTRTTADGVILIAGVVAQSHSQYALKGTRELLGLKRGSPVLITLDNESREGSGLKPAASCNALLEQAIEPGTQKFLAGPVELGPIEGGSVEFGP